MSSLSLFGNVITDCFRNVYEVVQMRPNGMCGFNCFAHCFSGQQDDACNVVEYIFRAFESNPSLFREQTEFGIHCGDLGSYKSAMRRAVASVRDRDVPSRFWLNDGHIVALSHMFNVAVFVYDVTLSQWIVYNRTGRLGYICLLLNGNHFDVLQGLDSVTPPVPANAIDQGLPRHLWHEVNVSDHRFLFPFVWQWPSGQTMSSRSSADTVRVSSYADAVKTGVQKSTVNVPKSSTKQTVQNTRKKFPCTQQDGDLTSSYSQRNEASSSLHCTVCSKTYKSTGALNVHMQKMHKQLNAAQANTVQSRKNGKCNVTSESTGAKRTTRCSLCDESFSSKQALCLHIKDMHKFLDSDDDVEQQQYADVEPDSEESTSSAHKNETRTFSCCLCKKVFGTVKSLNMHQMRKHKVKTLDFSRRLLCCDMCNDTFGSQRSLQRHTETVHSVVNSADVSTSQVLLAAAESHDNKKMHKYLDSDDDVKHQRYVDIEPDIEESTGSSRKNETVTFSCSLCKKVFGTVKSLSMHQIRKHKISDLLLHCDMCSATFRSQQGLQKHTETMHLVVNSADVSTSQVLLTSVENHCDKFTCHVCSRQFTTTSGLRVHVSRMHKTDTAKKIPSIVPKQSTNVNMSERNNNRSPLKNQDTLKNFSSLKELYKKYPPLKNSQLHENNPMHMKLKQYHDKLMQTVNSVSTEKVTEEVRDIIKDITQIDSLTRKFTWNEQDIHRLNNLNAVCKKLPVPRNWYWAAEDNSQQGIFNKKRMEFCVESELQSKVIHCEQCSSTGILVGLSQINSSICVG